MSGSATAEPMGPVSFESLPGGESRSDAMRAAGLLADAGIQIVSIRERRADPAAPTVGAGPGDEPGPAFELVVRSADAGRAQEILAAAQSDPGESPGTP